MPIDAIVVFGALFLIGTFGFAVAWVASTPTGHESKRDQLDLSLERAEKEIHTARELLKAGR